MKKPEEIKPEIEAKLTTVGSSSSGFIMPPWFIRQWGLEKGKKYIFQIKSEAHMGPMFRPTIPNSIFQTSSNTASMGV